MKVFVTGASGFVGSAVVDELLGAGHTVLGLARSEESAAALSAKGIEVIRGNLEDIESLKRGAESAVAVIHTAFIHDFSKYEAAAATDKAAIEAIGAVLAGSGRALIVTGGLAGLQPKGQLITEDDVTAPYPRASESTAIAIAGSGVSASVIRLPPSVHDRNDYGFIPMLINIAKQKGVAAYVGEGSNRWPAVHRLDAARLFRLAAEKGAAGARYNAIGDEGIPMREIAGLIGEQLNIPVVSKSEEEAAEHFGWMARFITLNAPASREKTSEELGWQTSHIGLIEDMKKNYF